MQHLNNEILTQLNHLIKVVNDARNGFAAAAEKEENTAVKNSLQHFKDEHEVYLSEIKALINEQGGNVGDAFSPLNNTSSNWMEVNQAEAGESKDTIINACVNGENAVIEAYQKVVSDINIEENIKIILKKHLTGMEYAVRKIRNHLTPTL